MPVRREYWNATSNIHGVTNSVICDLKKVALLFPTSDCYCGAAENYPTIY